MELDERYDDYGVICLERMEDIKLVEIQPYTANSELFSCKSDELCMHLILTMNSSTLHSEARVRGRWDSGICPGLEARPGALASAGFRASA